ncbi:hypothetical protein E3C22_10155 [Jiella endophytica]|uniref:Uncharacterized protein n=1 Tax=Jiella endophytica TaxID=2558362 RepID=A0A4Y8RJW4_9HYPH|nr:hypothetical protein [Jiella endophytica]TFF22821.1 hypothetical protein E3C22_10155 [Jiella endophytica]
MMSRILRSCLAGAFAVLVAVAAISAPRPAAAAANVDPAWWNGEIARAEADADRLATIMRSKGTFSVGTLLNEVDVDIHSCHILSIMLGKDHLTPLLVAQPDPPQPDDEPGFAEGVESNSRSNWAHLARTYLAESDIERIRAWNLDCVGKFGITGRDHIREDSRRALVEVDGEAIRVLGNVEKGFYEELKAAIEENPGAKKIQLGSAGGSVGDAVKAGRYIRQRGLATELYNNCQSACSLVFLGGADRTIWSPYPELGFHRIASGGRAIPDDSDVYGQVRDYAFELGVDGNFVVAAMMKAGVKEMHHPFMDDLCAANVATWVQRTCFGTPPKGSEDAAPAPAQPAAEPSPPLQAELPPAENAAAAPGESGDTGLCADIRAQRQRLAAGNSRVAEALDATGTGYDAGSMVEIYDAMLRDHGC